MNVLWVADLFTDDTSHFQLGTGEIFVAGSGAEALALFRQQAIEVVVLNTPLPDWTAVDLISEMHALSPLVPVIVRHPDPTLSEAVHLTRAGAHEVLAANGSMDELAQTLRTCPELCSDTDAAAPEEVWRSMLIGSSQPMKELHEVIRLVGPRRCTVLIGGETGTGKEVVARALHLASPRGGIPMVAVNCAALPEHLLESELFGHVRGAFTGALANRTGRFEQAHRGTLFLDEIADLPMELQAKLLRVLQERELQRLGSSETVRVDVRIIAACNADLLDRVRTGRFREDLYYRLNVVPVTLSPLRDRPGDIPALVAHFIRRVAGNEGIRPKHVVPEALHRLMTYDWPGNVRQLENAVETAMVLTGNRDVLRPEDFRLPHVPLERRAVSTARPVIPVPDAGLDFERTVGAIEMSILEEALRKTNGNKKQAAEMLGLKRTTLTAKLKSLEETLAYN